MPLEVRRAQLTVDGALGCQGAVDEVYFLDLPSVGRDSVLLLQRLAHFPTFLRGKAISNPAQG